MSLYLLDTNHLGDLVNDEGTLRERLQVANRSGNRIGTCVPVLCELEVGLRQTARLDRNRQVLSAVMRWVRTWPVDPPIVPIYAEIYRDLRKRGRAMSVVDIMLAALSTHMGAIILTSDRDFEALPDLRVENWRTPPL